MYIAILCMGVYFDTPLVYSKASIFNVHCVAIYGVPHSCTCEFVEKPVFIQHREPRCEPKCAQMELM